MNTKRLQQLMGMALVTLLLAGCGGAAPEPTAAPTQTPQPPTATPVPPPPTPTPAPTATPEAQGDLQPLDAAACSELADAMAQALGVAVTTAEAPLRDCVSGKAGAGCQATATGTGLDFEHFMVVADTLREIFEQRGWQEDPVCTAAGPTGTGTSFRQGNIFCLLSAGWEPSEDADCPTDQPISACELSPEQKLYTVAFNCAQDTSAEAPQSAQPPAVVALEDGTQCAFAGTGATLAFDGRRLNYTCAVAGEDQVGLLGDLQQSGGVWTAEKVVIGHDESGFFIKSSEMVTVQIVEQ
jgi:hypothetical protein